MIPAEYPSDLQVQHVQCSLLARPVSKFRLLIRCFPVLITTTGQIGQARIILSFLFCLCCWEYVFQNNHRNKFKQDFSPVLTLSVNKFLLMLESQ